MNVIEVIKTADEILSLGINVEETADLSSDNRCVSLLSCCNFLLEELSREFASDCRTTVVQATDGFVDTRSLSLCRVISVVDSRGNTVPFKYAQGGIRVDFDGRYNLTYAHLPNKLDFTSEVALPTPRVTFRIFVYGVVAEYLRRLGDYVTCAVWQEKFDAALSVARRKSERLTMPSRRWLC